MKQIKITQYGMPDNTSLYINDKMYSVYLGNNIIKYFPSYKGAKMFLAKTNRFLNSKLHELNYIYTLMFSEYRRIWFFLESEIEIAINIQITNIDKKFNFCCRKANSGNGNVMTIKNMLYLADCINIIFNKIKDILLHKKYYTDLKRVEIHIKHLNNLIKEITEYPK